jgi:hypothetical protein
MKEKIDRKSDERSLREGNWTQREMEKGSSVSSESLFKGKISIFPTPKRYGFPPNARM